MAALHSYTHTTYFGQILVFWVTYGVKLMSLLHGWGWQPTQTASHIHSTLILICCPLAYSNSSSLTQFNTHNLIQISVFWVTGGVKMMSLCHGWGLQPTQTDYHIHIRHIWNVWAHWYVVHGHTVVAVHSYTHTTILAQILGFWLTCGVKMMSLHHGQGWQPTQTASCIHIGHI